MKTSTCIIHCVYVCSDIVVPQNGELIVRNREHRLGEREVKVENAHRKIAIPAVFEHTSNPASLFLGASCSVMFDLDWQGLCLIFWEWQVVLCLQ